MSKLTYLSKKIFPFQLTFKLQTTGKKSTLVDRLFSHLQSIQTDANSQQRVDTSSSPEPEQENSTATLPQQLLNQLSSFLQQAQNPGRTSSATAVETNGIEDDRLSAASLPVRPINPASEQAVITHTSTQGGPVNGATTATLQSSPSLLQPALPPIPSRIKEKIARGEYIDFTTILPKSMFGAQEPQSQTFTLQLNPSGDNLSFQPQTTTKKITSFGAWMEAWNVYLAVRLSLNPSCAPSLVAYQRIITSANSNHPLHAWLGYDVKFRTKAANDPALRWDIRDLDLWLECFPGTAAQPNRWPCTHCGGTNHYPNNCPFRPSSSHTNGGGQSTPSDAQQRTPSSNTAICRDYNRSNCYRAACKYAHRCDNCGGPHQGKSCPRNGQLRHF